MQDTKPYVLIYQTPEPYLMVESWKLQKFGGLVGNCYQ